MPMFQTDAFGSAFILSRYSDIEYPIAIKIGTGKHTLSGEKWSDSLRAPRRTI